MSFGWQHEPNPWLARLKVQTKAQGEIAVTVKEDAIHPQGQIDLAQRAPSRLETGSYCKKLMP